MVLVIDYHDVNVEDGSKRNHQVHPGVYLLFEVESGNQIRKGILGYVFLFLVKGTYDYLQIVLVLFLFNGLKYCTFDCLRFIFSRPLPRVR